MEVIREQIRQDLMKISTKDRPQMRDRYGFTYEQLTSWLEGNEDISLALIERFHESIADGPLEGMMQSLVRESKEKYRQALPQKPVLGLLADELRNLAAFLESADVPKELKGERFVSAVRGWHAGIEKYVALLQK